MNIQLTMCDTSQGLVEGGRVTVISERDTYSSGQKPSGQSKSLFILQEPGLEALIVHLVALATTQKWTTRLLVCQMLKRWSVFVTIIVIYILCLDVHSAGKELLTMKDLVLKQ